MALVVGLAASCSDYAGQSFDCPDDGACDDGLVCAFGRCVDPSDQRLTLVDIEVDPSSASLPVQDVFDVDLRASPRVDVALAGGVSVSGRVQHDGDGVDAFVLARPARSIAGRVLAPTAQTNGDGAFSLLAVDGFRYGLTVVPSDASLPIVYDDTGFRARGDEQSLDPVLIPSEEELVVVSGRVVSGQGVALLGVKDVDVRLKGDDGRVWSSTSRTAEDGSFQVVLARGLAGLTLEVRPTAENAGYPEVHVAGVDGSASVDLGDIDLGFVSAPVAFTATVVSSDGSPAAGAIGYFRGAVGNGEFRASATTDGAGRLELSLPAGTYDVAVVGPAGAVRSGLLVSAQLAVPVTGQAPVFALAPRVAWSGVVRDDAGAELAGAGLDVVRVGAVDGTLEPALEDQLVAFASTTDDNGAFSLSLDPGRYRVSTRPALGSNAPAFSELVTIPPEGLERDVELPGRAVVAGTAVFDGEPVPGAFVRVFSTFLDEQGHAILLGEGVADEDGAFEIATPDLVGAPEPAP